MEQLAPPAPIRPDRRDAARWSRATSRSARSGRPGQGAAGAGRGVRADRGGRRPHALPGRRRTGADPLRRAAGRAGRAPAALELAAGRARADRRRWSASPASASRAWSGSSPTRIAPQGWLVLESGSVSYGKATAYLPVIDLLKSYCRIEPRDDAAAVREKLTGKLLALDAGLEPIAAAVAGAAGRARRGRRLGGARPGRTAPPDARRAEAPAAAREPGAAAAAGLRGPPLDRLARPRRCSTVWSRACRPPASCCWSTTARSTSHAWGSKTFYTQLRIDPLAPASAEELLDALLGDDPPSSR